MTPCIEWEGGHQHGYGFHSPSRTRAHRRAWILAHGPIPDGLIVMHLCDNRGCVNVDHLRLGTHAENMADMKAKGRARAGYGNRKLTDAQVAEIRSRLTGRYGECSALGREFGVSHRTIGLIRDGRIWKVA